MNDQERQSIEERFRQELEEEHARRIAKLHERKDRARERRDAKGEAEHFIELNELKDEVRERFYKEHGYKLYTDSTGRDIWLPPEEYEFRMRRRKKRKTKIIGSNEANQRRLYLFYVGLAVMAVVLGLVLAR